MLWLQKSEVVSDQMIDCFVIFTAYENNLCNRTPTPPRDNEDLREHLRNSADDPEGITEARAQEYAASAFYSFSRKLDCVLFYIRTK